MNAPRAAEFTVLDYVAPCYSLGDYFQLVLDFNDHADMVQHLAPLGLGVLAEPGARVDAVQIAGVNFGVAEIYGTLVVLELRPEDSYEHLSSTDIEDARKVDAVLCAAGLAARQGELPSYERGEPPPLAPPRRPRPNEVIHHLVRVLEPTATGFRCQVERKTLTAPQRLVPLTVLLTPATRHLDHVSGSPCIGEVAIGEPLLVRPTTGAGPDGTFATVAETAEHVLPDAAGIHTAESKLRAYARAGIDLGLGDAAAVARLALFERAMDPDWQLDTFLVQRLMAKAHAFTGRWFGGPFANIVGEMLSLLGELGLPCDFRAHALVRAAQARAAAGENVDDLRRQLRLRMVEEAHRALAARGDRRQYRLARIGGEDAWLLLEAAQHEGLSREGILQSPDPP